ncbi:MAG TPA: hypothetical protein VFX61_09650 [Micromonosporaceae bacterium]|nr:hypothetical protein [Micromonosporaceae bacterium]
MSVAEQDGEQLLSRTFDRPGVVALLLGLVGVGYRLVLLLLDVPGSNSDEATFGLAALHIADGRSLPVYMYGQHYMGALESYFAAPLFAVFGPSWVLLRVPLLLLYAIFVYLMYRLTRRLYSPWLGAFIVGLLALGSERVIRDELTAVGGRAEVKPAAVLLLLLAVALGQSRIRRRWLGFGIFGLVAGLSAWDDWLVLPYLATITGVLLVGCWRELLGRAGLVVLGGFALGLLPLILDNLNAPPGQDSWSVLQQLNSTGAGSTSFGDQVRGAVLVGIPIATGLCPGGQCESWQTWWGVLYLPLLLGAAVLAVVSLRRPGARGESSEPVRRIRHVAQLALAVAGVLTVIGYARSPAAALTPIASARYLSILQISLPAVLWPLWLAAGWWRRRTYTLFRRAGGAVAAAVLVALSGIMVFATAAQIANIRPVRDEERRARALATSVQAAGIRYVYGDYWICNRLIFNTGERVICAVLGDDLRPGQDRYAPYPSQVHAADRPAFIFGADSAPDRAFQDYLRQHDITAELTETGGYRIYRPRVAVRSW